MACGELTIVAPSSIDPNHDIMFLPSWLKDASNIDIVHLNVSLISSIKTGILPENISTLSINAPGLTSLDFSNLTKLTSLTIDAFHLTHLYFSHNTNLTSLSIFSYCLTSLDLSNLTNLTSLTINSANSTILAQNFLDLSDLTNLTSLTINDSALTSLDLSNLSKLNMLDISDCNSLTTITGLPNITHDITVKYSTAQYHTAYDINSLKYNSHITLVDTNLH